MTSPNQPKPPATSKVYSDVHSRGSKFGQDLRSEQDVRSLLMRQGSSPFQSAFAGFAGAIGGVISGIAQGIGGKGAGFSEISAAVDSRLGPIDSAITQGSALHAQLADKVSANMSEQAALNKQMQDTAQSRWNQLQEDTNRMVQAQLWHHQDMLELLDIRSPKTYGWGARSGSAKVCPYSNSSDAAFYWSTPYVEVYSFSGGTYVACRGEWVGAFEISINWDNGAVDNWSAQVRQGGNRVFHYTGGALHISKRWITITVSPRSLLRSAILTPSSDGWRSGPHMDLVRYSSNGVLRLRNAAMCTMRVVVVGEEGVPVTITPGNIIPPTEIIAAEQPSLGLAREFVEIDDPSVAYTFPKTPAKA